MNPYSDFRVLLDDAAEVPGLGFHDYAGALAEMIVHSKAEFAVGIFGSWGSGKTTLMRDIARQLKVIDPEIVSVWFTAWRYEKEAHLIVPLLDVLREELDTRAQKEAIPQGPLHTAAAAIARAGKAFLAGLRMSVTLPGVGAEVDVDKVMTALKEGAGNGSKSLSFYQAGFVMLHEAISTFSADGARRVVVFVDDLDRCLPSNALDLLESMKLFFDVEGCVFVVGLDQTIAERAVALKYVSAARDTEQPVSGTDYLKKIFQVPFALPRISTDQLQDYLDTVSQNAGLAGAQGTDFDTNVRRHLRFLPGEDSVNPREVKRLINTYILQLKMLGARLGYLPDPNIVLALQCMSFRPDWRELYDHLAADPQLFQSTLNEALGEPVWPDTVWLSGSRVSLPAQFVQYLKTDAEPLLDADDLGSYVSAAESTHSTDPSLLEAQTIVNRLRQALDDLTSGAGAGSDAANRFGGDVRRLLDVTGRTRGGPRMEQTLNKLDTSSRDLTTLLSDEGDGLATWAPGITPLLDSLDNQLRELRRQTNVGAYT